MMKLTTTIMAIMLAATTSVAAETALPIAGTCEQQQGSVQWSGTEAMVTFYGVTNEGTVVGLRPHGDAFKLSIVYENEVLGPSEVSIFQVADRTPPAYRMAFVSYDDLQDGPRVIKSIFGYNDAICAVVR